MLTFLKGLYDKTFGGKPAAPAPAPASAPKVSSTATASGYGAVSLGSPAISTPKAPAQTPAPSAPTAAAPAVVSSAIQPTLQRLQSQAGTPASTPVTQNFAVDTTTKTTADQLKQSSRGGLEQKRSDLERQLAKLREPSREQLRAQEQLASAEQALANVTAGQTARLADLRYYNQQGVFGGGQAAIEGQIDRESTLQAIQAQGSLSAAQSAYDRLSQARQQEIENLRTFQSMTMPEVLGTPTVNKSTGEVTAYIQRADGTVGVESIGNVGPDASFDIQSVIRNEATGQAFAVGTRNGELVAEPLAGTAGLAPTTTGGVGGIGGGGLYDILDYRTANATLGLVDDFNANPTVKRFSALAEAANQIAAVDPNTKNPADHQALVYAFAKALDPESVVREGEYETIKKYAQNITSRYGGEISNAVNGTGFLSPSAIQNIQQTVAQKYQATLPQYEGIRSQYGSRIDRVAGQPVSGIVLGETAPVVAVAPGSSGLSYDDLPDDQKADRGFWGGVWGYLTGQ